MTPTTPGSRPEPEFAPARPKQTSNSHIRTGRLRLHSSVSLLPAPRSTGRTQESEAPVLRRGHPALPNSSPPRRLRPSPTAKKSQRDTHRFTLPLFTFPASETLYFRLVKYTSVGADQWRRCWQSILGNVVERRYVTSLYGPEYKWRRPSCVTARLRVSAKEKRLSLWCSSSSFSLTALMLAMGRGILKQKPYPKVKFSL